MRSDNANCGSKRRTKMKPKTKHLFCIGTIDQVRLSWLPFISKWYMNHLEMEIQEVLIKCRNRTNSYIYVKVTCSLDLSNLISLYRVI